MNEIQESLESISGRMLANQAITEALLLTVLTEHPHLKQELISNLADQQLKADRLLEGAAHSGFSERLQGLMKDLAAR